MTKRRQPSKFELVGWVAAAFGLNPTTCEPNARKVLGFAQEGSTQPTDGHAGQVTP